MAIPDRIEERSGTVFDMRAQNVELDSEEIEKVVLKLARVLQEFVNDPKEQWGALTKQWQDFGNIRREQNNRFLSIQCLALFYRFFGDRRKVQVAEISFPLGLILRECISKGIPYDEVENTIRCANPLRNNP